GIMDWLARKDGGLRGGTIEQRGAGGFTLCERCNNNTGSWYGRELIVAASAGARILRDAPLDDLDGSIEPTYVKARFRQQPRVGRDRHSKYHTVREPRIQADGRHRAGHARRVRPHSTARRLSNNGDDRARLAGERGRLSSLKPFPAESAQHFPRLLSLPSRSRASGSRGRCRARERRAPPSPRRARRRRAPPRAPAPRRPSSPPGEPAPPS